MVILSGAMKFPYYCVGDLSRCTEMVMQGVKMTVVARLLDPTSLSPSALWKSCKSTAIAASLKLVND